MLFSRRIVSCYYQESNIIKFHELLSQELTDTELIWRDQNEEVEDPEMADNVLIKYMDKNLFTLNRAKNQGILRLSLVEGDEEKVFKAFREAGLEQDNPELSTPIMLALLEVIIFGFICMLKPEAMSFLSVFFGILLTGIILYSLALLNNFNKIIRNIASTFLIIGVFAFAPSSLLLFPLIIAISKKNLYNLIENSN